MERTRDLQRLMPVLVEIQCHLDGDLSLETLARVAGLSPHHFHRLFGREIGETVKRYTQRLRLEQGALRLLLHRGKILQIALDCGFQNHETFTRAFRKHFGVSPRAYRRLGGPAPAPPAGEGRPRLGHGEGDFRLSATKVQTLEEMHLAFIRHVGPYEAVSDGLWKELTDWAAVVDPGGPRVLVGLAQDAPGITPDEKLRFDAALPVPRPFSPEGRIGHQVLPSRTFAVTSHFGHFRTLPRAYGAIVARVGELRGYHLDGLPTVEIYRTTQVNADYDLNHTDIYLPVRRS